MDRFYLINTVQRNMGKAVEFWIEANQEPAVIVLFDVVRVNGPLEFLFLKIAIINSDGLFVHDGIKTVFEPVDT